MFLREILLSCGSVGGETGWYKTVGCLVFSVRVLFFIEFCCLCVFFLFDCRTMTEAFYFYFILFLCILLIL